MKPGTIGFDGTPLLRPIDGIGRYTEQLIDAYARLMPQRQILIIGFVGDRLRCPELLAHPNVRLVRLPFPRKAYSFMYSRLVRLPVDQLLPRMDAFVGDNFTRFPFVTKPPSLVVIHDLAYRRYPETIEPKNLAFLTRHVRKSLSESAAILVTSPFVEHEINELFPGVAHRIEIVAGATHLQSGAAKKRSNYLLAVGTREPRKNLQRLIDAYTQLDELVKAQHPLVIVGASGWGDAARHHDDHISFVGRISDTELERLYREAHLLVFPSLYEGFGLPLLEALSVRTPVACADIPPFREIAGTHASYFDPLSVESIRTGLAAAIARPQPVPAGAVRRYSWQASAEALERAIEAVAPSLKGLKIK